MIAEFLSDSGESLVILKMLVPGRCRNYKFVYGPEADPNINAGAEAPLLLAARDDQVGGTKFGRFKRPFSSEEFFFKSVILPKCRDSSLLSL